MQTPCSSRAAPRTGLALLAVLVVGAHALVLQAQVEPVALQPSPKPVGVLMTRSITEPKAEPKTAQQAVQHSAQPGATARASGLPNLVSKKPLRQPLPTFSAIESIANTGPVNVADTAHAAAETQNPSVNHPASNPADTNAENNTAAVQTPSSPASAPPASAGAQAANTELAATVTAAVRLPGSARLQYSVVGTAKGLNYFANAELDWRNNTDRYDAVMRVSALFVGSRSMTSSGTITPTGLAPERFADKYKAELAAHFDAVQRKVSFSANTPDALWSQGIQDRVSVFLQVGGILAGGADTSANFATGSTITAYTVGPRDADVWTFTVAQAEQLSLPSGDITAIKLIRQPKREYDQRVEVWYAPSLGYLPVRSRITQANGDFIDQQLKAITQP